MTITREEFEELQEKVNLLIEHMMEFTKLTDEKVNHLQKNINKTLFSTEKIISQFDEILKMIDK